MRKIVFILPVLILFGSCASSRKSFNATEGVNSAVLNKGDFSAGNITKNNFFIEKADVEINSQGNIQNVLVTLKYEVPGIYLISIRSKTGIEAARIYITKDSVLVNDRMNRILYYGGTTILSARYGIDHSLIPLIFGDIVSNSDVVLENLECKGDYRNAEFIVKGKMISYRLDCKSDKLKEASIKGDMTGSRILFMYDKFVKSGAGIHASEITMEYPDREFKVKIRIRKVNYIYEGKIEFIPGAKYERRELL